MSWARVAQAAGTAVAVFLLLYFPDRGDLSGAVVGGLCALIAVPLGLAAVAKYRRLPERSTKDHIRSLAVALGLGIGLGLANLAINDAMATLDPAIRQEMITRWARFHPWSVVVSGPTMEEIAYRLVGLGAFAWIVARTTDKRETIFRASLGVSSLLFGVAHIFYGGVDTPLYVIGMGVKSTVGGLVLGWVFWRRGLPYSILSHGTANGVHLMLMPAVF